jgi:hypothetical protein
MGRARDHAPPSRCRPGAKSGIASRERKPSGENMQGLNIEAQRSFGSSARGHETSRKELLRFARCLDMRPSKAPKYPCFSSRALGRLNRGDP